MIKEAIANYINARAERIKPCNHVWEKMMEIRAYSELNPGNEWHEFVYRCKNCGKINKFDSRIRDFK